METDSPALAITPRPEDGSSGHFRHAGTTVLGQGDTVLRLECSLRIHVNPQMSTAFGGGTKRVS